MNFTAVFCCYVLLPYFASIVFPPQEAITCYAAGLSGWYKFLTRCVQSVTQEPSSEEELVDESYYTPKVSLETRYFIQNRDHFNLLDQNTWYQKYLIYSHDYSGNGIIFLRIGTDVDITEWNMQNGRWYKFCRDAKAMCVGIERRGYGVSLPHGNLEKENLKYMTNEQALADVAWFIYNFRSQIKGVVLPENLKWVVHGRGKQGALAVWLRMKFPHLVQAAFSLSAPVLAKEDYDDYFKLIESEILAEEYVNFKIEIQNAYQEIQKKITENNFKELGEIFKFCDKNSLEDQQNGKKNIEFMYFMFAQILGAIMQFGIDDLKFIKEQAIKIMLGIPVNYQRLNTPINRFAHLMTKMLEKYNKDCLQINYDVAMNQYRTTSSGYKHLGFFFPQIFGNRTTLYQSCFEIGQFETFDNFFGTSIGSTFYTGFCKDVFEEPSSKELLERGVRQTNIFYGGLNLEVSHVFFVYGSRDPYRKLGVTDRVPEKSITRFLEGANHCYELDNENFIPGIKELKKNIYHHLLEWLQQPQH